jgi:NAD(P)-dependent dehydrogenase (short-subunit alcohol dehydrogenase family)
MAAKPAGEEEETMAQGIDLSGKVAVITAGAGGLGAYAAVSLARFGADVAIGDVDREHGAKTMAEVEALGRRGLYVDMNALHTDQVENLVKQAADRFGRIDILVNNAGGVTKRNFMDSVERSWRKHADINFFSMLAATHAAVNVMKAGKRGGVIINVASVEGLRGAPGFAVYAACKAGMISFTRTMAAELADDGIRTYALCPDMVRTPGIVRFGEETPEIAAARERYIPLRRMGDADEYGGLVAFLCSDMASYLTGIEIRVDGGALAASGFQRSQATGGWELLHP